MAIWSLRKFYIPILLLKDERLKKKITTLPLLWKLSYIHGKIRSKIVNLIKFLRGFKFIWSLRKFYIPILLLKNKRFKKQLEFYLYFENWRSCTQDLAYFCVVLMVHFFKIFFHGIKLMYHSPSVAKYGWLWRFGSSVYKILIPAHLFLDTL